MYNDYKLHTVKKGETVFGIALQHGTTEDALIKANPNITISPSSGGLFGSKGWTATVKEGDTLKIPFYNEEKAKKGVKAITGKTKIQPGQWEEYTITQWHMGTPPEDRKTSQVKWAVYLLKQGKPPLKVVEKDIGSFRFMDKAVGEQFMIVAYRYKPDFKDDSALVVKIIPTEKREILRIGIKDAKFEEIKAPLSYGQKINVYASTSGMAGEYIHLALWEDDVKGSGHSKENEAKHNLVAEIKVRVGEKGVASHTFLLKPNFAKMAKAQLARGDKSEGSLHEYYVTAYADDHKRITASDNINVNNPDYKPATPQVRQQKIEEHLGESKAPKNETIPPFKKRVPVTDRYADPTPHQPPVTPATKAGVSDVYIRDSKGQVITSRYTGETIKVYIISTGLKGKTVKVSLYEEDVVINQLILEQNFNLSSDKYSIDVDLSKISRSKGDDYFEGNTQELFVKVEVLDTKATILSKTIDVDTKSFKPDIPDNVTVVKVGVPDVKKEEEEEEKKKCPNCDKDITLADIKKICVDSKGNCLITDDAMIVAALPHLNTYRKKVKINTCVRKAHFLAQIAHESKFQTLQEIFNWHWEPMIKVFTSYFKQFKTKEEKETEAKRLGRANKEATPGLTLDEQIKLANAIYGSTHPNGKLHTDANDGWRYSGKGFKQITWKGNYEALQDYFNDNMKVNNEADVVWVGGDNPYKLKNNAKDAMTSALAFWGKNNINSVATKISYESVENVTKKINPGLDGMDERKRYFKKAVEVLKTDECQPKSDLKALTEKGTVIVMSGVLFKLGTEKTSAGKQWPVYKTSVYHNMSLETYKTLSDKGELPAPNYITYLSRDAHSKPTNSPSRSSKRYGSSNEAPPGTYYLNKHTDGQSYHIYLSDTEGVGESGISGRDGWRGGIAIHGGWPAGTEGCLTTHTKNYGNIEDNQPINPLVQELIDNIPDFDNNTDDKPVRFIIEERVATKNGKIWIGESI